MSRKRQYLEPSFNENNRAGQKIPKRTLNRYRDLGIELGSSSSESDYENYQEQPQDVPVVQQVHVPNVEETSSSEVCIILFHM